VGRACHPAGWAATHPDLSGWLAAAFRWVDPGPHSEHLVSDVTGWWRDGELLAAVGPALAAFWRPARPTVVVSPEVSGLLVRPLVALSLGVGFAPAMKEGGDRRIVDPVTWADAPADHRGRRLRLGVRTRHLGPADRVLIVDDWVATGAQLQALHAVVAARDARVVGCAAIVATCPPPVVEAYGLRSRLSAVDLRP
jgi:adenine phosphoribosyltransferase